jgi:Helix-turn-helix domain
VQFQGKLLKMQQMILGSFNGEWFEVKNEEQARLLTDPVVRQLLEPFIGSERSATQAAEQIGCSVQRLLYRIEQFKRAGLLLETRQERRSGRPIRYYRAVADGFRIPFAFTPFADVEAMIARQHAPYDRLRNRASARQAIQKGYDGRVLYRDVLSGELNSESAIPAPKRPRSDRSQTPSNDVALIARLSIGQVRAFAREFNDLTERLLAASRAESRGQAFLVYLGMQPLVPGESE